MTDQPLGEVIPPTFDAATRNQRQAFIEFDERDVERPCNLEGMLRERLDKITERFYQHLPAFEETRKVFKDEAMIRREVLKKSQFRDRHL